MNFKDIANKRESCRSYDSKPIDPQLIEEIMHTVRLSPSACNSQPWKFVVCSGEVAKQMPGCVINPLLPINGWTKNVPVFVVVCETKAKLMRNLVLPSQHYAQVDIGIAAGTLCYGASEKGLSTCILGVFNEEKIKKLLDIPKDIKIRLVITLGYAKNHDVRDKVRKDYDEIVCENKWR